MQVLVLLQKANPGQYEYQRYHLLTQISAPAQQALPNNSDVM